MKEFKDKFGFNIKIDNDYILKLKKKMPPVDLTIVEETLVHPDAVKVSCSSKKSRCYYKKFSE